MKKAVETIADSSVGNREISSTEREKGTVQSSIWQFRQLSPKYKWFIVVSRQDKDWGVPFCKEVEDYALVATVSDRDNQDVKLYTQIQVRIREQERARVRLGS